MPVCNKLHHMSGCEGSRLIRSDLPVLLTAGLLLVVGTGMLGGCGTQTSGSRPAPTAPGTPRGDSGARTDGPAVSFRVMIVDQDGDGWLTPGERVTMEVEVVNAGTVSVRGAVLVLSGSSSLSSLLGGRIPVGTLEAGERKHITASAQVPTGETSGGRELIVALEVTQPGVSVGGAKLFDFPDRRAQGGPDSRKSAAGERAPVGVPGRRLSNSAGALIGIGAYREAGIGPVPFAARDAETMASYLDTAVGIQPERVKVATDAQALAADLDELLEHWLPQQVGPGGTVVIYFAGRAFVDRSSGAVFLLPYEGQPGNPSRAIPLRRVHSVVDRLPARQALLWMDLVMEPDGTQAGRVPSSSLWTVPSGAPDSPIVAQIVGVSGPPSAAQEEAARHGLLTSFLLEGLRGKADVDQDGTVIAGELCDYVRDEVSRAVPMPEHRTLCASRLGQASAARAIPVVVVAPPSPPSPR